MECVTVVSVPDNQVISQGVNHHCVNNNKGQQQHSPTTSEESTGSSMYVEELRSEVTRLKRALQTANTQVYHLQEKVRSVQQNTNGQGLLRSVILLA
jgi:uncharacterized protein YlxW (UPF0749 family)